MSGETVVEERVTSGYHWRGGGVCVPVTFLALVARATLRCLGLFCLGLIRVYVIKILKDLFRKRHGLRLGSWGRRLGMCWPVVALGLEFVLFLSCPAMVLEASFSDPSLPLPRKWENVNEFYICIQNFSLCYIESTETVTFVFAGYLRLLGASVFGKSLSTSSLSLSSYLQTLWPFFLTSLRGLFFFFLNLCIGQTNSVEAR